jgi:hypothetical protein
MAYFNDDDQFSFDSVPGGGPRRLQGDMPTFSFDAAGQGQAPPEAPETPSFDTPHAPTPSSFGGGQTSLYQPSGASAPATSMAPPSNRAQPTNGNPGMTPNYQSTLDQLKTTSDPQQQAVLKDQLARNVFSSLKDAGHDVKWQGDQLMVDGRAYVVGGGTGNTGVGGAPGQVDTARAQQDMTSVAHQMAGNAAGGTVGQYGMPAGAVDSKFNDMSYHSPKYDLLRTVSKYPPTADGMRAAMAEMNANGGHYQITGDDRVVDTSNGDSIDLIQDVGGPTRNGGSARNWSTPMRTRAVRAARCRSTTAAGCCRRSTRRADRTRPTRRPRPAAPSWAPGDHAHYTPGDITTDDIPNYSFDELFNRVVGDGDVSRPLLDSILANPESLDAHTVDSMKAKSKDELAEQQQLEEEDLRRMGNQLGIDDSPWLASERLASRRGRDTALVKSNRDIDITAATTNAADKRSAAQLGVSYDSMKGSQRQAAASLAADTTLRQAALTGDRMALRESVSQKAAELGISEDQVMGNWLQGLMDDATRRYGIDVGRVHRSREAERTELRVQVGAGLQALGARAGERTVRRGLRARRRAAATRSRQRRV